MGASVTVKWQFLGLLAALACRDSPQPPDLSEVRSDHLLTADLDGDGQDEVVTWEAGLLSWPGGQEKIEGRLVAHDAGPQSEGAERIALAFGPAKHAPRADATIWTLGSEGARQVPIEGARFTDVQIINQGLLVTVADKNKTTKTLRVTAERQEVVAKTIMGLKARQITTEGTIAIGRLYGDEPRSHGGLEIHRDGLAPVSIDTVRGVRALGLGDVDGDGETDLLFADGWHFRYAKEGEARLAVLPGPAFTTPIRIGRVSDSYTIDAVEVLEPGRVLAIASSSVVVFEHTEHGWSQERIVSRNGAGRPAVWNRLGGWLGRDHGQWLIRSGMPHMPLHRSSSGH